VNAALAILNDVKSRPWAMAADLLEAHVADLQRLAVSVSDLADPNALGSDAPDDAVGYELHDGVAVIPIVGIIRKAVPWYYSYFGIAATSTLAVRNALATAMEHAAVRSILLIIDSPGGSVAGVQELADAIFDARDAKPVSAHVSDLCASAAYWLGSQTQFITANASAQVGSIGVYTVLYDEAAWFEKNGVKVIVEKTGPYKGTGVSGAPITDEQRKPIAEIIQGLGQQFIDAIARGRGAAPDDVATYATGRTWLAPEAAEIGLIDEVANSDLVLARLAADAGDTFAGEQLMLRKKKAADGSAAADTGQASADDLATAQAEGAAQSVERLKALEGRFEGDEDFARECWEAGMTDEQVTDAHYTLVCERVGTLGQTLSKVKIDHAAALEAKDTEHAEAIQAKDGEIAELKAAMAGAGAAPVEKPEQAAAPADAVKAYNEKFAALVQAGDQRPAATIADQFPALQAAYLAAANASETPVPAPSTAQKPDGDVPDSDGEETT